MVNMLTDHDRRQLAGQWARRYPAAMLHSPYLTTAELQAAQRRVLNRARERRPGHVWLAREGYARPPGPVLADIPPELAVLVPTDLPPDSVFRASLQWHACDGCTCCSQRECHRGQSGCYDPDSPWCPCTSH